jgi:hypothetical protein
LKDPRLLAHIQREGISAKKRKVGGDLAHSKLDHLLVFVTMKFGHLLKDFEGVEESDDRNFLSYKVSSGGRMPVELDLHG